MGICCCVKDKHVSGIFWSLGYDRSINYLYVVYKIDNPIQSSLLSSLVINSIQGFNFDHNTCILSHDTKEHILFIRLTYIKYIIVISFLSRIFYYVLL